LHRELPAAHGAEGGAHEVDRGPLHDDERYGFIAPFLRGVNTDINAPLSYAIWSAIFVEFWGITALGLFRYGSKFFNFRRLVRGDILNGIIDVFVGLLELVSEFARLISFTFRLFGNIFAGEVLLFMMSFLVPFLLVDVFYALEIFVGLIQAFVFAMLTLVFGVMAVSGHGEHEEHAHEAHAAAGAHG
jgi:F-type H+-transporting ATPase subunit a